jgi:hypothetical protein
VKLSAEVPLIDANELSVIVEDDDLLDLVANSFFDGTEIVERISFSSSSLRPSATHKCLELWYGEFVEGVDKKGTSKSFS